MRRTRHAAGMLEELSFHHSVGLKLVGTHSHGRDQPMAPWLYVLCSSMPECWISPTGDTSDCYYEVRETWLVPSLWHVAHDWLKTSCTSQVDVLCWIEENWPMRHFLCFYCCHSVLAYWPQNVKFLPNIFQINGYNSLGKSLKPSALFFMTASAVMMTWSLLAYLSCKPLTCLHFNNCQCPSKVGWGWRAARRKSIPILTITV